MKLMARRGEAKKNGPALSRSRISKFDEFGEGALDIVDLDNLIGFGAAWCAYFDRVPKLFAD